MPTSSQQGYQLLSMDDVDRILAVTDALELHRDWVIIPIDAVPVPKIVQQPDAKIIIHAPVRELFEPWLRTLRDRLQELDLGRVPRKIVDDPNLGLTGPHGPLPLGTRAYLGSLGMIR
jgi:hypothetical protein